MLAVTTGRDADADEHFRAAAATHERIQAPTWLARTRLEWGRMLLGGSKVGDVEQARELLRHALATAREVGLTNLERQAAVLLR
jgi:phage terminase small subunit